MIAITKVAECPYCDVGMVEMVDYYKCPDCGGQWWPGPAVNDIEMIWRDEQRYKHSMASPGGGSKSGKKHGDKEMKKRPYLID